MRSSTAWRSPLKPAKPAIPHIIQIIPGAKGAIPVARMPLSMEEADELPKSIERMQDHAPGTRSFGFAPNHYRLVFSGLPHVDGLRSLMGRAMRV